MPEIVSAHYKTGVNSGLVVQRPVVLCGVIISVATSGDYITLYNGRDVTSGDKVFKMEALQNRSSRFAFPHGVECDRGIYVECSQTTVDWTVTYHFAEDWPGFVIEAT